MIFSKGSFDEYIVITGESSRLFRGPAVRGSPRHRSGRRDVWTHDRECRGIRVVAANQVPSGERPISPGNP